ncbi:MAG: penicillin-binding protein 2 [Candidatus Omnitrophica bacterium]|nr:penicillin-binding protein 2 [Candidatus Omnitrophota bacterium]
MRIKIFRWLIALVFIFLMLGLADLQLRQSKKLRQLSNKNCLRLIPQEGCRGKILDRNGEIIVDNYLSYDAMVLADSPLKASQALLELARILNEDPDKLKRAFREGFIAPFMPVAVAKNIDIRQAIALEELKGGMGNVFIQPHPLRKYPYARMTSHLIGYVNEIDHWRLTKLADYGYKTKDIMGFGGVEEKYDYFLRQEEGALSVEVDHRGRLVRVIGFKPSKDGKELSLTVDIKAQKIAEDALGQKSGCVILMDPNNGEIIALSSHPDFNPSDFVKKRSLDSFSDLFSRKDSPLTDRAITGMYPPGSVFKLVVASAALETKKVDLDTGFFCSGSVNVGKRKFACWSKHGQQDLMEAIKHSCNVFFYRTGLALGPDLISEYALRFSFGKTTGIDLPYEESGLVPSPIWRKVTRFKNWYDGDTANFAIGQGDLLVTPLQVTRMMAVFANQGYLVKPYILRSVSGKDISGYQKKISRIPLKENTVQYIRKALKETVSSPGGTAHILSDPQIPVSVAGKTGTAQVSGSLAHGWFAGFFPFDNPRYVICVFLENGGSGYWACGVAKEIIENMSLKGLI